MRLSEIRVQDAVGWIADPSNGAAGRISKSVLRVASNSSQPMETWTHEEVDWQPG